MKSLKVSLSVMAIVLGIGSALATAPSHRFANKKWGRLPASGMYTEVTGQTQGSDYSCSSGSNTCTAEFPSDVDPNNQNGDSHPGIAAPQNVVSGVFGN